MITFVHSSTAILPHENLTTEPGAIEVRLSLMFLLLRL